MSTCVLTLILAGSAFMKFNINNIRDNLVQKNKRMAELIALNSTAALIYKDKVVVDETLSTLSVDESTIRAYVFTKNDEIFSSYSRDNTVENTVNLKNFPNINSYFYKFEKNRLKIIRPITLDGKRIGSIYLESDTQEINQSIKKHLSILFYAMLLIIIFAYLVSSKLQELISKPVLSLAKTANSVSTNKDYSIRASKQTGDEIGDLVDRFNEMLEQIQSREGALNQINLDLDKKIKDRTIKLENEIAERKQIEKELLEKAEALNKSEEQLRLLVEGVSDYAIFMLNIEGEVETWNSGAERITGYTGDEIIGKHFSIFYPTNELAENIPNHSLKLSVINEKFESESSFLKKDKSKFWASININSLKDDIDNLVGYSIVVQDITSSKKAREELQTYASKLEESNSELKQFAYVASHDLQEPLRMVGSYLGLLERRYKDKLDQDANDFIFYAVDGAKRMQVLINDLLSYSRVSTKAKPFESANTEHIVKGALKNLEILIEESGAEVDYKNLPEEIVVDSTQVGQLIQNLVSNAIKFCKDRKPKVEIGVEDREGEWLFSVRDNGIGIDPEYYERIFIIFQRLHGKGDYPGTGIGLSICKKIVERHGGKIWVESEQGEGSTFFFTISKNNNFDSI